MTSTTTALSSAEQTNLNTLLCALPEQYAAVDCSTYRTYRSIIVAALTLIGKIPVYGSKIAAAIQFLITIADGVCPGQGQQVAPGGGATGSTNCPDCTGATDPTGIDLLKAAGILHPNVTLDQIVEFQKKVSNLPTSASCAVIGQMVYSGG